MTFMETPKWHIGDLIVSITANQTIKTDGAFAVGCTMNPRELLELLELCSPLQPTNQGPTFFRNHRIQCSGRDPNPPTSCCSGEIPSVYPVPVARKAYALGENPLEFSALFCLNPSFDMTLDLTNYPEKSGP